MSSWLKAFMRNSCFCSVGKPCLILLWPHGLYPARRLCSRDFPGKESGVCCHFLLQGIFLTQGLNPCLQHWLGDSLPWSHLGSPCEKVGLWKTKPIVLMRKKQWAVLEVRSHNFHPPYLLSISLFKTQVWTLDPYSLNEVIEEFPDTFFLIPNLCFLLHTIL